jgi:hypothetical protein
LHNHVRPGEQIGPAFGQNRALLYIVLIKEAGLCARARLDEHFNTRLIETGYSCGD